MFKNLPIFNILEINQDGTHKFINETWENIKEKYTESGKREKNTIYNINYQNHAGF